MRKRSRARELALMVLYQMDITRDTAAEALKDFWENHKADADVRGFASQLVTGTIQNLERIDQVVRHCAENWEIHRMATVDRNILRLATYELLFVDEIPLKVSINEAVDLAKKFGDVESGRFVNGILDRIGKTETTPAKQKIV